jgi:hypothetical protein
MLLSTVVMAVGAATVELALRRYVPAAPVVPEI